MPEDELDRVGDDVADPIASVGDDVANPVRFMETASMAVVGRLPWSSNATFLARLADDQHQHLAVYKPVAGERPLWDFPAGLDRRERAAYLLSEHVGLGAVPPTVIRDGQYGSGSVQWFIDADHSEHYFTLLESRPELAPQFRNIAAFDVLINNTDRKSGHLLFDGEQVWAIDNGLCFAAEEKLRTVIWEFADDPIDEDLLERIRALVDEIPSELAELLDPDEVDALAERAGRLLMSRVLPVDRTGHRYPWPLV